MLCSVGVLWDTRVCTQMGTDECAHEGIDLNRSHPQIIMLHGINLRGDTDVGIASHTPQSQGFATSTSAWM